VKTHSVHVCRECGTTSPRWSGRCSGCGEWNTLDEERTASKARVTATVTTSLRDVAATSAAVHSTGVGELDRVLGGGFIAGSTTLLFGEPGVGKSTLALMSLRELAASSTTVLLIAAEESVAQVAQRARRLGDVPIGLDERRRRRATPARASPDTVRHRLDLGDERRRGKQRRGLGAADPSRR